MFKRVWSLIKDHYHIVEILSEDLAASCSDARYYRIIATFIKGYQIEEDKKVMIDKKVRDAMKENKHLNTPERRALIKRIVHE